MTTASQPSIAQYLKENSRLTGKNIMLMSISPAAASLFFYAAGVLNLRDTVAIAAIAMIARLLSDRLNVEIFLRTMPVLNVAVLRRTHRKVAMWLGLLAVIMLGIYLSVYQVPGLGRTMKLVPVVIGSLSLSIAVFSLTPDWSRLAQLQALRKTFSEAQTGH